MVDRIGKGGPPLAPPPAPEGSAAKGGAAEIERPFQEAMAPVHPPDAKPPVEAAAASPLERLRAGQIDVGRYVEEKITDATAHLEGLSPVELEAIRAMLRDQLATDPALTELVARLAALAGDPPGTQ